MSNSGVIQGAHLSRCEKLTFELVVEVAAPILDLGSTQVYLGEKREQVIKFTGKHMSDKELKAYLHIT